MSLAQTNREPTRSDINNGVKIAESVTDLELGWKYKTSLKEGIEKSYKDFLNRN